MFENAVRSAMLDPVAGGAMGVPVEFRPREKYDDIMMTRFLRWADNGCMTAHGSVFDMGIATRQASVRKIGYP